MNEFWVVFIRTVSKSLRKACTQTCQERKERSEICGLGACIGQ